jgi:hypothetical protein
MMSGINLARMIVTSPEFREELVESIGPFIPLRGCVQ